MASRFKLTRSPPREPAAPPAEAARDRRADRGLRRPDRPPDRRWWLAAAGLLLLHLSHPCTWQQPDPGLWFPPAGVALALLAWLGPAAAGLVALDSFLVGLQAWAVGLACGAGPGWGPLARAAADAPLAAGQALAAWWCLQRFAKDVYQLGSPRAACLFLVTIPGLVAGLFALPQALLAGPLPPAPPLGHVVGAFWVTRALGLLALAPLLLVVATPGLARRGLAAAPPTGLARGREGPARLSWGDRLEIGGLAVATGVLGVLLALAQGHRGVAGWQLWILPLLLVVWAGVRQGLRGGTVVAAAAAVLSLTVLPLLGGAHEPFTPLQGNLLAQTITALLVGASAGWIRASEARYRQVVGHVPSVLYSARLQPAARPGSWPWAAEITFVSPASQALLGCAPEELVGDYQRWLQRIHPGDQEIVVAALAQLCRQNQPVTCEYRLAPPAAALPAAAGERAAAGPPPAAPAGPAREGPPRVSLGATPPPPTSLHRSRVFVTPLAAHQPPPKERWVRDTLVPHLDGHRHLDGWDGIVTDITEQRLLADDLRRTTSMFHTLVAHLPAGVFFVQGPGGQPILINARARQLLGRREDPSAGVAQLAQVYRLYRPDGTPYPPDELPVCQALRRGLTSMRDDIVVHRPDGRQVPLVAWAAPLDLRGHGQPDAAVWVFEDLTALRQAETARRDSEAQLRAVVATMAEGLVVFDRSGTIGECNPAAAVLFGLDPDQLRGRCLWDPHWVRLREDGSPLGPDDLQALFRLRSGQPVRNVVLGIPQVHRADYRLPMEESGAVPRDQDAAICHLQSAICNPVRWVLVNAMPLTQGADGVPDRVVATFADITGYRHALEVLRVSEEKYRGLVESLPLMLLQADRQLRITYVNPAAQALTGYDLAELGEPGAWQALVHPEDRDRVLACQRDAVGGQTARFEARFRAKDGSEKVGYVVLQPRWQAGQVIGTTALVVDMTLQRRLEHELLRAQRLELVGRLASGVAHDFNNLLTVILTLTELAQHNLPADHVVREDLRRIAEAGEQAAGLAGQLLTFSKQRRVVPHRIDLNQVARRTLELLRGSLPPDITVEADLAGEPLPVLADSLQLHQVLMNLCLNARDAMPHGGRLGLRTDAAPAGPPAGPGWVRVAVRDSGHGMDDEVRGRIFEPFFSTKERGTGLGLAVVRQIVESFGGRIEVHTQPGQGSQFVVWLPRAQDDGMTG